MLLSTDGEGCGGCCRAPWVERQEGAGRDTGSPAPRSCSQFWGGAGTGLTSPMLGADSASSCLSITVSGCRLEKVRGLKGTCKKKKLKS